MRASAYPLVDAGEAAALVMRLTPVLGVETVSLEGCAGRVLAQDLIAAGPLPTHPVSAVDGFAVRSADAGSSLRILGESAAGRPFTGRITPGTAARILTGGVLPDGADSVVMVEDARVDGDAVALPPGLTAGTNFHAPGADLRAGEMVIRAGAQLGGAEIGLAAALGLARLSVRRRPKAALVSTGDELVEVGSPAGPGQIPDSNRWALLAALREAGADVRLLGIAPDTPSELRRLVEDALVDSDVLVTSGGVSVGTHDLIKPLLESLGTVHVGRVKLKPGKPFTFATIPSPLMGAHLRREEHVLPAPGAQGQAGGEPKLAFGLPGFPVSSLVTFEVFVRPALRKMQGFAKVQRPTLQVRLAFEARSVGDRTEYHRVTLTREGSELVAHSTGSQSSSRLMSLAGADALVRVPPGERGIPAGTVVEGMILALP